MASLFYPTQCLYKDFWSVPGDTIEQRSPIFIDCEITKARYSSVMLGLIIILITIILVFIPVNNMMYRPAVIGGGIIALLITISSSVFARHFAEMQIAQINGEYKTWT